MKILKSPWIILLSMVGGILFGLLAGQRAVDFVAPVGDIYIRLLQMSIVPIVMTAIISGIAQLIRSPGEKKRLVRVLLQSFLISMICFSCIALLVGFLIRPGDLTDEQQGLIGEVIESAPYETDYGIALSRSSAVEGEIQEPFLGFIVDLVPSNIFTSLVNGNILQLVFFCFLFGIATALINKYQSNYIISFTTSMFVAFQRIIDWAMYPLPFGLFALVAKQVSSTGVTSLLASVKFILSFYLIGLIIIVINTLVVAQKTRAGILTTFRYLLDPMIVAFSTRSSVATIPSSLYTLSERFGFDRVVTKIVLPLGMTLARYGNVIFFSLAGIYVSQIYEVSITLSQLGLICLSSILAGIATSGATGFATLGMITIVLNLLGLPTEAILIVFFTIDPIIDPMRTLLIVHCNIMLTVVTVPTNKVFRREQRSANRVNMADTELVSPVNSGGTT